MLPTPQTVSELDELISSPTEGVIETLDKNRGRIAVLGAGGKMGFHVSLMLQKALRHLGVPDSVTSVSRFGSAATRQKFVDAGLDVIAADLTDAMSVKELPDFDVVFFLAGIKFGTDDQPGLLRRMNSEMPRMVAERYRDSRIVALSSGCVYSFATPESGGATESSETDPPGEYAESCLARETAFSGTSARFGTETALIRLNYSIDLRYGVLLDIGQQVFNGSPICVDTGYVNVIWQGDAIAHTIAALNYCSTPPFVVNVTGRDVLRVRDIANAFADHFDTQATFQGAEEPTAWLSNASLSHRLFGTPNTGIDQMILWTAEWIRAGGETLSKPTHFQVRDGRY